MTAQKLISTAMIVGLLAGQSHALAVFEPVIERDEAGPGKVPSLNGEALAESENPYIAKVMFQNDEGQILSEETYLPHVKQKSGERLDLTQLSLDVQGLREAFPEYVSTTTQINPGQNKDEIVLTFEFLRQRIVSSVRIRPSAPINLSQMGLREKLSCRLGTLLRGQELSKDKEVLRREFVKLGYPSVQVRHEVNVLDQERGSVALVYHVDLGSSVTKVSNRSINGNTFFDQRRIARLVKSSDIGQIFNPFAIEADAKRLRDLYEAEGFADAQVKVTPKILDGSRAEVTFEILEGKRYMVRSIAFEGNTVFSSKKLLSALDFKLGSPYTGKTFRSSSQKIREMYGEQGYAFMNLKLNYDASSGALRFSVAEGQVHYVGDVVVKGNSLNDEKSVLSFFKLKRGQKVNTKLLTKSIGDLKKTGIYSSVAVQFEPKNAEVKLAPAEGATEPTKPAEPPKPAPPRPAPEEKETTGTIVVIVEESASSSIRFSFGYGTKAGFEGEIGYSDSNIAGTGIGFSISAIKSEEDTRLSALFRQKYIFDSDYNLNANINYGNYNNDFFTKESIAARIIIEREIVENLTLGLGTRIEFVNISDAVAGLPAEVYDAQGETQIIAGLVGKMIYEKQRLDASGEAYGGYRIQLSLLPSYADQEAYMKAAATVLGHQTVAENSRGQRHIITGRITLGYATDNVPFHEKFYAGGNSTLRGFQNKITPDGSNLGGSMMASAGAYYSFPLFNERFKGVVFVEAASVGNSFDDLGSVRVVGGIGVRANLRDTFLGANVEAGFAFPAISDPIDVSKPFYLLIGDYHPIYDI